MGGSIQIGRIFGIPFRIDYTWFLIFIFFTLMLSMYTFPAEWPTAARWGIGIATSVIFFASVLAHELSHSLVGRRYGIPVKSITLFLFGGVAHISREASDPATELKMALAGPLCSLTLCGLFFGISYLSQDIDYVTKMTWWLGMINGILAVFNMIPGFPLDGGRVLRAVIWRVKGDYLKASRIATNAGYMVSYVFIGGGILLLIYGYLDGLWFIILGFFLNGAARTTYRQTVLREALKGYTAQDVMTGDFPRIPGTITIKELVQKMFLTTSSPGFLIGDADRVDGVLTINQLKKVPRKYWEMTTAGQAMTPVENIKGVHPSDDALQILEGMEQENLELVAVVNFGKVVGIIPRDNMLLFAQRVQDLQG
jgi:Zn-dependent protease/CBS domain-containing protein